MTQVKRTFDILDRLRNNYPKEDIFAKRNPDGWVKYSVEEYYNNAHNIAYALLDLGYGEGDKAITICNNRPEWNFIDLGLNLAKMIHVPVYSTLNDHDFLYIFNHSDAKVIFIGHESLYKKVFPIIEKMDTPPRVFLMDHSSEIDCLDNLYQKGVDAKSKWEPTVEQIKKTTSCDECATIIYTSGTTGIPKGVMLSHWNMMFNAIGHAVKQTVDHTQKMVSFLPLSHIYERSMNYEYQYLGISTYYAEGLGTIARDLAECHADGFCAVPRVLEMMYGKLEDAGKKQKGIKRFIYKKAWRFANRFDNYNRRATYKFWHNLYDKLVYSKWRANLGGNEMLVVSGGSSIQAKIVRLFNAAKLHIYEGYGMTETSPVIAVNSPVQGFNVIGTVGKPMEGTDFMFADDGEMLTRGPHVMLGYYKDPIATQEIIDKEGWLHTGDIGEWYQGEYVRITDRKKEIFKLSIGKYIAPQVIENMLRESSLIQNCIVIGANQKFASAIIIPDFDALKGRLNLTTSDKEEIIKLPEVISAIKKEVEIVNKSLAAHEKLRRERLVADDWNTGNDLLSQTLKLKRANINAKYELIIKDIYNIDQ